MNIYDAPSDMTLTARRFLVKHFHRAHQLFPGGISFEVGHRMGGSALIMLDLIDEIYKGWPPADRPVLISADPYGCKPYNGGNGLPHAGLYGAATYAVAKKNLAESINHIFYYMRGEDALKVLPQCELWYAGERLHFKDMTFVLLDGAHDAETITTEALYSAQLGANVILVDNADADKNTVEMLCDTLVSHFELTESFSDGGEGQIVFTRK